MNGNVNGWLHVKRVAAQQVFRGAIVVDVSAFVTLTVFSVADLARLIQICWDRSSNFGTTDDRVLLFIKDTQVKEN